MGSYSNRPLSSRSVGRITELGKPRYHVQPAATQPAFPPGSGTEPEDELTMSSNARLVEYMYRGYSYKLSLITKRLHGTVKSFLLST